MSYQDAIADFLAFMEANGVKALDNIGAQLASGQLIRFRCEGDGPNRKNGWAILYLDERPAGAFGNYKQNTGTLKWKAGSDAPALSHAEREALTREWREAREKREAIRLDGERQAALDASRLWQQAGAAQSTHPYVERKRLDPAPLRQHGETLLVPMWGEDGVLWNLQRISGDGTKRFLRGGRTKDLFCIVGTMNAETTEAVIAEGYATADAAHKDTGFPCIAAFSAKNMVRVARIFGERRADVTWTVFADDDAVGIEEAAAAAQAIGAYIAGPIRGAA